MVFSPQRIHCCVLVTFQAMGLGVQSTSRQSLHLSFSLFLSRFLSCIFIVVCWLHFMQWGEVCNQVADNLSLLFHFSLSLSHAFSPPVSLSLCVGYISDNWVRCAISWQTISLSLSFIYFLSLSLTLSFLLYLYRCV